MACFRPLHGFLSKVKNSSGKRSVVFNRNDGFCDRKVDLPCGSCDGCRLELSRQWAIRCVHEASLYEDNCFITLTFDDDHLDPQGSLRVFTFQDFMKRLRRRIAPLVMASCERAQTGRLRVQKFWKPFGVRYFHCGEYGSITRRPHHHACLFNFDFPDKVFKTVDSRGYRHYFSVMLSEIWPYGLHDIGNVTFESAAYVARYVLKKIHDEEPGESEVHHVGDLLPEFVTMSRRPGIGAKWFEKYKASVFPHDSVVIRGGIKCKPPKFYMGQLELTDPKAAARIRYSRKELAKANPDNADDRLEVREVCLKSKLTMLKREL